MQLADGDWSPTGAIVASVIGRVRYCVDMPCRLGFVLVVLHGVGRARNAGTFFPERRSKGGVPNNWRASQLRAIR
jgi:hypothetical protein